MPVLLLIFVLSWIPRFQTAAAGANPAVIQEWNVEGVTRQALIYAPRPAPGVHPPVIFAFHGHGGNMNYSARAYRLHRYWPEAVVVYMQGLPTATRFDPLGRQNGWQFRPGMYNDRDLKFFDAALATIREKYHPDNARIFAMGHSNGGSFTYLLWAERHDVFAAVAPAAATAGISKLKLKPLPAFHVAGRNDRLVPFPAQARTIAYVRLLNGCGEKGKEWAQDSTYYASKTNTPFVTLIHPGGHLMPPGATALMVKFFKEVPARPAAGQDG